MQCELDYVKIAIKFQSVNQPIISVAWTEVHCFVVHIRGTFHFGCMLEGDVFVASVILMRVLNKICLCLIFMCYFVTSESRMV